MDRLFVPIYARLLAAMLGAVFVVYVFVVPRVLGRATDNYASVVGPTLPILADLVDRELRMSPEKKPAECLAYDGPLAFVTRDALPFGGEGRAQLDRGEIVVRGIVPDVFLFERIGQTEHVLRWGPLAANNPIGGERGVLLVIALLLGLFVGAYLLLVPIQRRLRRLDAIAEELGRGRLESRSDDVKDDAIGRLGSTFNRMAEQLQRLIAAREELLRTVSHELRTPLQRAHLALHLVGESDAKTRMERALDEIDELIEELLTYVRLKAAGPSRQSVDVRAIAEDLCEVHREDGGAIAIEHEGSAEAISAEVDERLVRRAVGNLIGNALRHARGRIAVNVTGGESAVSITVGDDGPGVPMEERALIFEPFRTIARGPSSTGGHGLGLAIVHRIAELHGGSIAIETSALGGASFVLKLPKRITAA